MKIKTIIAVLTASLMSVPAWADPIILDLTGDVSSGSSATVDAGGFRFNFFTIALRGFDPTTFRVGDEVEATISLSGLLTVPTASVRNGVDLILLNTNYPGTTTGTSGTTALFDMGVPGLSQASGSTSTSQLVNGLVNFGGSGFSFDMAQSNFTVTALGAASLATDTAYFRYVTVDALAAGGVPEPATWALLILGFGATGAAMRRRTAKLAFA